MKLLIRLLPIVLLGMFGCSDSPLSSADGGTTADGGGDPRDGGQDITPLPPPPTLSGVVYIANFLSPVLRAVRIDGEYPAVVGDLQTNDPIFGLLNDPENSLLFTVNAQEKKLSVFSTSRLRSPSDSFSMPSLLTEETLPGSPLEVLVNPQRKRLYVFHVPPLDTGEFAVDTHLRIFDYTETQLNGEALLEVTSDPIVVPLTASVAMDPYRELLFLLVYDSYDMAVFDVTGDEPVELSGSPIILSELYPQKNFHKFKIRSLRPDPWRARVYAARTQSELSELVAFEYPALIPGEGERYSDSVSAESFVQMADAIDVDIPKEERSPLLTNAHRALVDPLLGNVFLSARIGPSGSSSGGLVAFTPDLELAPGCEAGVCKYQVFRNGSALKSMQTDGAACIDWTHKLVVGTTLGSELDQPGTFQLFSYGAQDTMQVRLPSDETTLELAPIPTFSVCD